MLQEATELFRKFRTCQFSLSEILIPQISSPDPTDAARWPSASGQPGVGKMTPILGIELAGKESTALAVEDELRALRELFLALATILVTSLAVALLLVQPRG
jgi:hypothetical protein